MEIERTFPMNHLQVPVNGHNGRGRPNDTQFHAVLTELLDDFVTAEVLRREQLYKIGQLRKEVYRLARKRGVDGKVLRAAARLRRQIQAIS